MLELPPEGVLTDAPARLRTTIAIVGSGPGGSVAASLLARAGHDVLVLEDGPYYPPSHDVRPYSLEEMELKYRGGGVSLALGRPKVTYVEARCVGGGSEVNAGLFYRTPADVIERWRREFAVDALGPDSLAMHFEAIEKALGVEDGASDDYPAGIKLREAAERLEFRSLDSASSLRPRTHDGPIGEPGAATPEAVATRATMTRTLLREALHDGARVLPNARVARLRRDGTRWTLSCRHTPPGASPRELVVEADTVFVSAGAIQTPALLRRSGHKRHVGNSLAMHATAKVTAVFPEEVNGADMGVPVQAVDEFAPRFTFTCASSSPAYLAMELIQYPGSVPQLEGTWKRMAVYSARIAGGIGSVRPIPGFEDPLVRYRLADRDLRDLSDGVRQLCRVLFEAGATTLYPSLLLGQPLHGPDDLARIPMPLDRARTNLMTIHVTSSCPMGEQEDRCAVDSFGKVHGTDGLYVADASVLCSAPTVNPQGTIMAVARRNLLHFLGEL